MKNENLLFYIIICTLCIFFESCISPNIYSPSFKGTHTVHKKNQVLISGGLDISPNFENIILDASYSPIYHLGVQLNLETSKKHQNFGFALGSYFAKYKYNDGYDKKGFHFDAYLGYSFINVNGHYNGSFFWAESNYDYTVKYHDFYSALGLHFHNNGFGTDIIFKPHVIDLKKPIALDGHLCELCQRDYDNIPESSFNALDISGKISLGQEQLQVFGAANVSITNSYIARFIDPISFSAGLNINLSAVLRD